MPSGPRDKEGPGDPAEDHGVEEGEAVGGGGAGGGGEGEDH